MALRLNWENPNQFPTTVEIYRGNAPLDRNALPAPVATLPHGTTTWVDTTAAFDATYYYVFVTKTATDRVVSLNKEITVTEKRGAGPQKILLGNENYGYFGQVSPSSFFNSSDIKAAALDKTVFNQTNISPTWYKFIRKGKVIYVPSTDFGLVNWDGLYKAGFIYGTDDAGPIDGHQGLAGVNQMRTVTLDGEEYLIRAMRGWGDVEDSVVPWASISGAGGYTPTPIEGLGVAWNENSEWNQLVYPITAMTPKGQSMENVSQANWRDVYATLSINNNSQHYGVLCQEREPAGTNVLVRGMNNQYGTTPRAIVSHIHKIPGGVAAPLYAAWVPVLELVVDVSV